MNAVRFITSIGDDGTIPLPDGIRLKRGQAEIIVLQPDENAKDNSQSLQPLLEDLAHAAEELGITGLPTDLAENHDHYAHGAPKYIDRP
jgi:hypothetical protein